MTIIDSTTLKNNDQEFKVSIIKLTPELATQLLKDNRKNRKLDKKQVRILCRQLRSEHWDHLNGDAIVINVHGQIKQGQHRCHAVIETGISIYTFLIEGVKLESEFSIDQYLKVRTPADLLSMRTDYPVNYKLLEQAVNLLSRYKDGHISWDNIDTRPDTRQSYQLLKRHDGLVAASYQADVLYKQSPIRVVPLRMLVFFAYVFTRIDEEKGSTFLARLMWQESGNDECPTSQARLRLKKAVDEGPQKKKWQLAERQKLGLVIKAWNFFVQGESLLTPTKLLNYKEFPRIENAEKKEILYEYLFSDNNAIYDSKKTS